MQGIGRGCLTRTIVASLVILLVLLGIGLVLGPLGASLLGIETPFILDVSRPHVELPSKPVFDIAGFSITNTLIASWFTIIVLVATFYACTRKMRLVPGRLQGVAEMLVEGLLHFVEGVVGGKHSRLLFPAVATIFIYVIANAYFALLPFFDTVGIVGNEGEFVPLFRAANTDINVPLSIAAMSAIFVETWGMKSLGAFNYFGEFINVGQIGQGIKQLFKAKLRPAIRKIAFAFINLFVFREQR